MISDKERREVAKELREAANYCPNCGAEVESE